MAIDAVQSIQAQAIRTVPQADGLKDGQVLDARVVTMLSDKTARLSLLGALLDVDTPQAFQPGNVLSLKVEWEGEALRLILQNPASTGTESPVATNPATISPATTGATAASAAGLAQAQSLLQGQPLIEGQPAVIIATGINRNDALPQTGQTVAGNGTVPVPPATQGPQGSVPLPTPALVLASTLARTLAANPPLTPPETGVLNAVPPSVAPVVAVTPVLSGGTGGQVSGGPALTPAAMQAAIVSALGAETAPAPAPVDETADALRVAFTRTVRQAADRQTSLAPLFANLSALAEQATSGQRLDLPKDVLVVARAILGLQLDGDAPVTAQTVKTALATSGVFLEANLAAGKPVSQETDLKAALGNLKALLGDAPETDRTAASPHDKPPLRNGQLHGQPPVPSSLTPDMPTDDVFRSLREQTEAGLARLTLTQAAALPDVRDPAAPQRPDQPMQFTVEIPIRYQEQTTIAQMQVSRDKPEGETTRSGRIEPKQWTVRFSMDCEPVGPVHAAVRLLNDQVGIRLWAERPATVRQFTALAPVLEKAMAATPVRFDGLVIAEGRPSAPEDIIHAALNPRHMLDRRS